MRLGRTGWAWICLLASIPLALWLLERRSAPMLVVRWATFNAALNRPGAGELLAELRTDESAQARRIAEIVQRCQVDVLLVCELDRDDAAETAALLADRYLAVGQAGQAGIRFPFRYAGAVNTGVPSGLDLDRDGGTDGPGDAWGFGRFPGQYGMALLSRYPILTDRIRTFRDLRWQAMPDHLLPTGFFGEPAAAALRLSSKSHWDVPIQLTEDGMVVHALCSHPTPPVFDGPEDRNGRRNHDEIRFWVDYLTPDRSDWIVDDAGARGGLPAAAHFVVLGDLNCDPADGDGRREVMLALLSHPRVQDPLPRSAGGAEASLRQWGLNSSHRGDPALDTGDFPDQPGKGPGNLRLDYVLPSRSLLTAGAEVFWPAMGTALHGLAEASDHRLVWVDIRVDQVAAAAGR